MTPGSYKPWSAYFYCGRDQFKARVVPQVFQVLCRQNNHLSPVTIQSIRFRAVASSAINKYLLSRFNKYRGLFMTEDVKIAFGVKDQ
jgi:hypothetical protein